MLGVADSTGNASALMLGYMCLLFLSRVRVKVSCDNVVRG
jgi:hypothetical protein